MKALAVLLACGLTALPATASTIDFTDGVFTVVTPSSLPAPNGTGQPVAFSETASGVVFTFTSLGSSGENRFGVPNSAGGMQVGGGGVSVTRFLMSASADVDLLSYTTGVTGTFLDAAGLGLDVYAGAGIGGTLLSGGNGMTSSAVPFAFASGPVVLTAGADYTFDFTGTGVAVLANISEIAFVVRSEPGEPVGAIPLPAGLPLLATALLGLGLISRRRRAG